MSQQISWIHRLCCNNQVQAYTSSVTNWECASKHETCKFWLHHSSCWLKHCMILPLQFSFQIGLSFSFPCWPREQWKSCAALPTRLARPSRSLCSFKLLQWWQQQMQHLQLLACSTGRHSSQMCRGQTCPQGCQLQLEACCQGKGRLVDKELCVWILISACCLPQECLHVLLGCWRAICLRVYSRLVLVCNKQRCCEDYFWWNYDHQDSPFIQCRGSTVMELWDYTSVCLHQPGGQRHLM